MNSYEVFSSVLLAEALTAWDKCVIKDEQLVLLKVAYTTLIRLHTSFGDSGIFLEGYQARLRSIQDMIDRRI